MDRWRTVEVYSTFMKVTGDVEVLGAERLSDAVNRSGDYLELRAARMEPLSVNYPVLSRTEPETTIAKSGIMLICPTGPDVRASPAMWRDKTCQAVAISTQAFSLVADVHLDARRTLRDHLSLLSGEFLPVTNISALWVAALTVESHALQRPFALLNPASILSFAAR